jgi:hypothetical protein
MGWLTHDLVSVLFFLSGIWMGKMLVLSLYMNLSQKILTKSRVISGNINHITGFILIGMAVAQLFKY